MDNIVEKEINVQSLNLKTKVDEVEVSRNDELLVPCDLIKKEGVYKFQFYINKLKEATLLIKEKNLIN